MEQDAKAAGEHPPDLCDALHDLDQAKEEAREDGLPAPSGKALGNAHRLLRAMYRISPRRFEIYPTPDGEIAIDAPGGFGRSVLLLCDSDGGALCLVNMNGAHRRARYSDTRGLPDGFVREALTDPGEDVADGISSVPAGRARLGSNPHNGRSQQTTRS